jgi:hypothetical protein
MSGVMAVYETSEMMQTSTSSFGASVPLARLEHAERELTWPYLPSVTWNVIAAYLPCQGRWACIAGRPIGGKTLKTVGVDICRGTKKVSTESASAAQANPI